MICATAQETILCCLVGLSPAVLTGTVWALAHQSPPVIPHRIIVFTTQPGAEALSQQLFFEQGWSALLQNLRANKNLKIDDKLKFGDTPASVRLIPNSLLDSSLQDIKSTEDCLAAANFFMENIRSFTEIQETQLIACIAGGRKSMSSLLHSVMCLIGRDCDKIIHLFTENPWETQKNFLFPGCPGAFINPADGKTLNSYTANVALIEIPFVPLRNLFADQLIPPSIDYAQWMQRTKAEVIKRNSVANVVVDVSTSAVRIDDIQLQLSHREFAFFLFFADRCKKRLPPLSGYHEMTESALRQWLQPYAQRENFSHWTHDLLEKMWDEKEEPRRYASAIRSKLRKLNVPAAIIQLLLPSRGQFAMLIPPDNVTIHLQGVHSADKFLNNSTSRA